MDGILEKSDGQRMGDIKGLTAEPAWYWPRKKTLRVYIVHAAARAGKYRQGMVFLIHGNITCRK